MLIADKSMKKIIFPVLMVCLLFFTCNTTEVSLDDLKETGQVEAALRKTSFSKGVNFSQWFEAATAHEIPFTMYGEQDFADLKSLGADVIRLPIRMHSMTGGAPDYTLDPLFLKFLDIAVDWAEKYELYLIIDNHSFHPVNATSDDVDSVLLPVWAQIARRYNDRSEYVLYEILNEPHGISDERWGEIQEMAIETIRKYDRKHTIIVGGTDFNSVSKLHSIPDYSDTNLIYTFHFYDPFLFTHQGASWSPPMEYLSKVPFPANKKKMPKLHRKLKGTWIENSLSNYEHDAASSMLLSTLDRVTAFSRERDVPVFCGEFGVYIPQSPPEDRVVWYEFVAGALDRRNISRTSWDYFGGFGIFDNDGKNFDSDINTAVVRALRFTPPLQNPHSKQPLTSGFTLFDDYPARENPAWYWGDEDAEFSFYETDAAEGEFAIRWENAGCYNGFRFNLDRKGNLSGLAEAGYCVEFLARADKPVRFDVRFINPESPSSNPWRMSYTINADVLPPDGQWHKIRIPFQDMREQGAWVGSKQRWLNPQGKFSWEQVNRLEFAAEHNDMKGCKVWFDSIKIAEP